MGNIHRYLIKITAVAVFLYGSFGVYAGILASYNLSKLKALGISKEMPNIDSLIGYAAIGAMVGLVGLIGSLGLFSFKKWGLYIVSLFFLLLWGFSFMAEGGIARDWLTLSIATAAFIYLLAQNKLFSSYV
ncbi:MAG: hypothetical protein GXP44_00980 [bacterium]|nr:hypothetical protein [bacterium]